MLGRLGWQNLALLEAVDMKLMILALIILALVGMAGATSNYTQDAQTFTKPVRFVDAVSMESLNVNGSVAVNGTIIDDGVVDDPIWINDTLNVTSISALNETTVTNLTASGTVRGAVVGSLTGTASRITVGTFIDPAYGLKNSTSNKAQINLSASSGLEFGSGSAEGAVKIDPSDASLTLGSTGVSVRAALLKHILTDGTAAATNVTVADMAVGDELVSVHAQATKANLASITDRTAEYTVGAGILIKSAGTNETGNQLDIMYLDRTA